MESRNVGSIGATLFASHEAHMMLQQQRTRIWLEPCNRGPGNFGRCWSFRIRSGRRWPAWRCAHESNAPRPYHEPGRE